MDNITVIENDVSEPMDIDGNIDYIIHAASLASPQYYSVCSVDVLKPNTVGTYIYCSLQKKKCKWFSDI